MRPIRGAAANALPRPAWGPLALTAGLHLLLALAWWTGIGRAPVRKPVQERASLFVAVTPLPASRRAAPSPPVMAPSLPRARRALPSASALQSDATARAPDNKSPDLSAPPLTPSNDAAPQAASAPDAPTGTASPASPASEASSPDAGLPGDLLASSKRLAGSVDRALRNGASPITAEPDRKWARFAEAVAGAHGGSGNTVTLSSYTAPDGVVIYRRTVGSRVICYRSGGVGGVVGGFGPADGQGAGTLPCPSRADWRRH